MKFNIPCKSLTYKGSCFKIVVSLAPKKPLCSLLMSRLESKAD